MRLWNIVFMGLLLLGLPAIVEAQFTCTTNNGAITITGYTGTNGNAVIPDTINGYPVTDIEDFSSSVNLTSITIPASVTNIAGGTFIFEDSLTAILVAGQNAYYSSTNGVLFNKNQTLLIQAPGGITGSYAIPATVTVIGDGAFEECDSLTNVSIGTNVLSLGANTFAYSYNLSAITIPGSVTNIGSGALAYCPSLTAINVDPQNLYYRSTNGILFDKPQTTLIQAPGGIFGSLAIPAGVGSIGTAAFADCAGLTGIVMPDSVTNIGNQAFESCNSLTNLVLGATIVSIGDYAFESCPGLIGFTLPDGVTRVGVGTFAFCTSLNSISLGNKVMSIGSGAFENCGSLTNVSLGNGITSIGSDAFTFCTNLTGITIPGSVTNIAGTGLGVVRVGNEFQFVTGPVEMVANCSRLTSITVDPQNQFYSSASGILFNKAQNALLEAPGAFAGSYTIPGNVNNIGAEAFQNCAWLTGIFIPAGVTNIGTSAFANCASLTSLTVAGQNQNYSSTNGVLFDKPQTTLLQFPGGLGGSYAVANGIVRLGNTAFAGCSNLTSITIPASITNIGNSTFANCPYTGIYFSGNAPSVTSSGLSVILLSAPGIPGNNFARPNTEAVYYLPGTTGWSTSFDGLPAYLWVPPFFCTPEGDSITINGCTSPVGAITIPNWINGLPVTTIASGAFDNTQGLSLTNIILGTNLTTIGSYAFAACVDLTSITIPQSVTSIDNDAFTFCDNLESVYFQGNAPAADASIFFHWSNFPFFPPNYEPPTPTTVYYLPGTTGWGTTFGGVPTVLWNPQAQTSGANFGLHANGFGFNITGAGNLVVVVEATTNLSRPDWQPVQTNTLATGSAYFSDPQWTNYPGRFYRFRSP